MKSVLLKELTDLMGDTASEAESSPNVEGAIIQHLALAASTAGVELDDPAAVKAFITTVRDVVTKDKAQLTSQMRRWTSGKARAAIKTAKNAYES